MSDKPIVYDLDILRPTPEYVLLGGKKIDISFVPSGIAIDIMAMQQELQDLTGTPEKLRKIEAGGKEAIESFQVAASICAKITGTQHKDMTKEWLLKNTNVVQLKQLIEHITNAVSKSLESIEGEAGKN
ncbi:hypothetical protein LCGC14_2460790 [marine sediment metagenome]|uniref:Tail assembly chaperone n=1 Tax=marine sediment metagenome TaxID=412755 RepID=A0A0F9DQG3_9ZZZZ